MGRSLHPPRLMCGSEPRAQLGVGTYATIVYEQVRLQHQYPGDAFFLLADYHALTRGQPESLMRRSAVMGATYLALGVDVRTSVLYRQSDVPQLFELFWLIACLLPPQLVHSPIDGGGLPRNLGAEIYPTLMAADLLGLRATIATQVTPSFERLDYACQIAAAMNSRLGTDFFPIPRLVGDFPQPPITHPNPHDLFAGPGVFSEAPEFNAWLSALYRYSETHHVPEVMVWFDAIVSRLVSVSQLQQLPAPSGAAHLLTDPEGRCQLAALIAEHLGPAREAYRHIRSKGDLVEEALCTGALRVRSELHETVEHLREMLGIGRLRKSFVTE